VIALGRVEAERYAGFFDGLGESEVVVVLVEGGVGVGDVLVDAVAGDLAGGVLPVLAPVAVLGFGAEGLLEPWRLVVEFFGDRVFALSVAFAGEVGLSVG
jgi:hypothetical protein